MAMKFWQLYFTYRDALEELSDEECGQVIKAVLRYATDRTKTEFPPRSVLRQAYLIMIRQYDSDQAGYEKRSLGGKRGGRPRKSGRESEADEIAPDCENEETNENLMQEGFRGFHVKERIGRDRIGKESSSSNNADENAVAIAPATMTTIHSIEAVYAAGIGDLTPVARDGIRDAVLALGDELAAEIMRRCIENGARQWSYCSAAYEKAIAQGLRTVEEYNGRHRKESGAVVDRPAPSGRDIFSRPPGRPRQLKRGG